MVKSLLKINIPCFHKKLFNFEIQKCGQILCARKTHFLMLGHICACITDLKIGVHACMWVRVYKHMKFYTRVCLHAHEVFIYTRVLFVLVSHSMYILQLRHIYFVSVLQLLVWVFPAGFPCRTAT